MEKGTYEKWKKKCILNKYVIIIKYYIYFKAIYLF